MVVQNSPMALGANRNATANMLKLQSSLEKLSSGYRINRAADDAAGLAISERMRAQMTALERAMMNAQDGSSMIQTADGALGEVNSMLTRLSELSVQAANGTLNADDRGRLNAESQQIMQEIDRIAQATNFNGVNVLDGSLSGENGLEMQVGDTADAFNQVMMSVGDMSSAGLGLEGLSLLTAEDAARALERVDTALERIADTRGGLGAMQNQLEHTIDNLGVTNENLTAAESRIRDVDMAKMLIEFTKRSALTQSAQFVQAQTNMNSQQVLQLLR